MSIATVSRWRGWKANGGIAGEWNTIYHAEEGKNKNNNVPQMFPSGEPIFGEIVNGGDVFRRIHGTLATGLLLPVLNGFFECFEVGFVRRAGVGGLAAGVEGFVGLADGVLHRLV